MEMYLKHPVKLIVSGSRAPVKGILIDLGNDILVLHNGAQFLYVPLVHLQQLTRCPASESNFGSPPEPPLEGAADLSYRKVLMNAKGMFSEVYITGNQSVHGYVTSIMNDFFVFYSPMYRSLYVSMRHLKTLIPYDDQTTPYALEQEKFPVNPTTASLARTFDQQLKKFEGEFIVLDLGEQPGKIGLLKSVSGNLLELVTADGASTFIHLDHVKTIHKP
ncbi:DUF2642 domain-containing protein [Cohnella sp. CFH 77786]|uniref:DUF2642 domain-containing protein n=1 Tax=Cohnella sp. CFH 77786 TaxID=2662265 RepID=UPI001C60E49F|nr:DUF2642 domain-containing protein [Cohnella sp. CFH 77786]MBW5445057.1 DUF2642 domain-containing protein [Cohnella sp. CFH 77786]